MSSILRARRLAAVIGVSAAVAFAAPGPVQAAPAEEIKLEVADVFVPAARTGADLVARLTNSGDKDVELSNVTVVVDTAGLATVADAGDECVTQNKITTCTYAVLKVPAGGADAVRLKLVAAEGAATGATGTLAITAEADGFSRSANGKVTVAEAGGLVAGPDVTLSGAPGSTLSLTPVVRNGGAAEARGAVLVSSGSSLRNASYQPQYSNCVYTETEFACTFDQTLAAGKTYAPAAPVAVRLSKEAPAPSTVRTDVTWLAPDDAADAVAALRDRGKAGTGPALALGEKPQTDVPDGDDATAVAVEVTGSNQPDLAATGVTVRGAAGTTVTAKIEIKNLGPAAADGGTGRFPSALVKIPAGTTVVKAGDGCEPFKDRADEFRCLIGELAVGEKATWDLDLKLGANGTGPITARLAIAGTDEFAPDRNTANDAAELRVNPPASPSPSPSGSASPSPSASPTAVPSLPITGANATPTAALGVALLLAGVALVALTRRRESNDAA